MNKFFLSIGLSVVFAFLMSTVIEKTLKPRWELIIGYDYIKRNLNVDYEVLDRTLNINNTQSYRSFIGSLDGEITLPDYENPCSQARSQSKNPNIIVTQFNFSLKITAVHNNKNLLLECEKFIDERIKRFEYLSFEIIKEILRQKRGNMDAMSTVLPAERKRTINILKKYLIKILDQKEANDELYDLDIQNLSGSLMMIYLLDSKQEKDDFFVNIDLSKIDLISKTYRRITQDKTNILLLNISLYIIIQSILLLFFYRNIFFSKKGNFKSNLNRFFKIFKF